VRALTRHRIGLLACAVVCADVAPAVARELRPGIIGADDRVPVDVAKAPWTAVGQVNAARYRRRSSCTGTLIAPDRVVTAAHCITDPSRGKVLPLGAIHFLTGVFGSRWKEHAQPRCVILPETRLASAQQSAPRRPPKGRPLAWFADDVAVLILEKALAAPPLAIDPSDTAPGGKLAHAAYAGDRRHRLTADLACALKARSRDGLWLTDCDTHHAGSGGPLLTQTAEGTRLAAIMVGVAEKRFSVAVPAALWRGLVARRSCAEAEGGK
jgi:protease YdgD